MASWVLAITLMYIKVAVFAILGHIGHTVSPGDKGPGQENNAILVAFEEGSIALGFGIRSSAMVGDITITVIAMLHNFA